TTAQATINSDGEFSFSGLPLRNYYLKVVPETDSLLDGYYVADPIQRQVSYQVKSELTLLGDTLLEDVFVRQGSKPIGVFPVMYGIAYRRPGRGERIASTRKPAVAVPMYLSPAGTTNQLDYKRTDSTGGFSLTGLEAGSSYDLLVDVPGLPMDSATAINFSFPAGEDSIQVEVVIDSAAIFLDFNPTTSLEGSLSPLADIKVGPVPVRDQLRVEWLGNTNETITYRIMDLQGKLLQETTGVRGQANMISLESLPSGVYLLQARTETAAWIQKISKE
ncbi:MAG: T9SS type A sorting domain-containing protein, partial [Bacteroidota bacterium]